MFIVTCSKQHIFDVSVLLLLLFCKLWFSWSFNFTWYSCTLVTVIFHSLKPQTNSCLTTLLQINYFTTLSQKNICLTTRPQINSYLTTLSQKTKKTKRTCLTTLSQTNSFLTTLC